MNWRTRCGKRRLAGLDRKQGRSHRGAGMGRAGTGGWNGAREEAPQREDEAVRSGGRMPCHWSESAGAITLGVDGRDDDGFL